MSNKFKKEDSNGKKLKEVIGAGLDVEHYKKVKAARAKTSRVTYKCTIKEKYDFQVFASKDPNMTETDYLVLAMNALSSGQIKIK